MVEDVELPKDFNDVEVVNMDVLDDCNKLCVDEDVEVGTEFEDDVLVDVDVLMLVEKEPEEDWLLEDVAMLPPLVTELDEVEEVEEDVPEEVDVDVPALVVEVLVDVDVVDVVDVAVTAGAAPIYLAPKTPASVA